MHDTSKCGDVADVREPGWSYRIFREKPQEDPFIEEIITVENNVSKDYIEVNPYDKK